MGARRAGRSATQGGRAGGRPGEPYRAGNRKHPTGTEHRRGCGGAGGRPAARSGRYCQGGCLRAGTAGPRQYRRDRDLAPRAAALANEIPSAPRNGACTLRKDYTMSAGEEIPTGIGGLRYPVSQVSLVVRDLHATMERYYEAFGWSGWRVFDHVDPVHHGTELRGKPVPYSLRGAEVMVGSLNFELLEPIDGPSLWREVFCTGGRGF